MTGAIRQAAVAADAESLAGLVLARSLADPNRTVVRVKRLGVWKETNGADFSRAVADCAAGFLELGLRPGETIGILARPCPEWFVADLAVQSAGLRSAGFHAEKAPGELADLVRRCATRLLVVDTLATLEAALDLCDVVPGLDRIVCLDRAAVEEFDDARLIAFDDLLARGAASSRRQDAPWSGGRRGDLAAIIPTSGVTAPSRGATFTNAALCAAVRIAGSIAEMRPGDERLSLMSASHAFERVFGFYAGLAAGVIVNFPESSETALADLRELQPHIVAAPPAFWSEIARGLARNSAAATRLQRGMFERAMRAGGALDQFVLRKVRRDLGLSRTRIALSAGAPLAPHIRERLAALGLAISDVYALAEAAGPVAVAANGSRMFAPANGVDVDIGAKGELRLRAASAFLGFAGDPPRADEWIHAGDFAEASAGPTFRLGDAASLAVAGAPTGFVRGIEDALAASPYIASSIVAGERPDQLRAFLLADFDNLVSYAQKQAIPFTHYKSLVEAPQVVALYEQELARIGGALAPARIVSFTLAHRNVSSTDPEMGPASNLRRRIVMQTFSVRAGQGL
ncbi:MAG: AMP-binding protein [Hyphomicrobiales bacterium]|nr:AMP-binding protein [Hyphomicrobiales bacterium]